MCGNPLANRALVISSGLYGVEGLFGSAVQLALLERYLPDYRLPPDLAIVIIHILNPFGCAWYRRWNEDNIDLNRNFLLAEFGTYSMLRVLGALRAENRAHWWGQPEDKSYQWAKDELAEVFVPHDRRWRDNVLKQAVELCLTGIESTYFSVGN